MAHFLSLVLVSQICFAKNGVSFLKVNCVKPYVDPGIFVRGVQSRRLDNSLDNVFFIVIFSLQNLFYCLLQGEPNGFIKEKSLLFEGPTFSRCVCVWGGEGGGVQILISIEIHITCDLPGGPDPLSHSLWIRT